MNLRRLLAIVIKELRQVRRDRLTLAMIIGIPVLQLLMFGFAINMDVRNLDAAVLDQAQTAHSRALVAELGASQVLNLRYRARAPQELSAMLRAGRIAAAIVIPPDFEARLARGDRPAIQMIVDGTDQTVQQAARQLAQFPFETLLNPDANAVESVEIVNYYNPGRKAPINTVPGLVGVILTMTMVLFTAVALVRERERGNLEMLIATPVSPWELTLGKVLPFVAIGLLQTTVVLLLGWWVFSVPVRGSLSAVYAAALVFIVASLALGVLLSTLARTQFQAMQLAFFIFLPQILLSGFMFPFAGMPMLAQWFGELLPMTHFLRLMRGIMLRGADLTDLWQELAALAAFAAIALVIAVTRVKKRLD